MFTHSELTVLRQLNAENIAYFEEMKNHAKFIINEAWHRADKNVQDEDSEYAFAALNQARNHKRYCDKTLVALRSAQRKLKKFNSSISYS